MACQMAPAIFDTVAVELLAGADGAEGAKADPAAGLSDGMRGAAPVNHIAAVPGVKQVGWSTALKFGKEGSGM